MTKKLSQNSTSDAQRSIGSQVRLWRKSRGLSQEEMASAAKLSARHISCIETNKSNPSREVILRLCQLLEVPLRERNDWLLAAGYAPMFRERKLESEEMRSALGAIQRLLDAHAHFPSVAFDRRWNWIVGNRAATNLIQVVDKSLREPPMNLVRLTLHPLGLAPHVVNLRQWREHFSAGLQRQIKMTGDAELARLLDEVTSYPPINDGERRNDVANPGVFFPLQLVIDGQLVSLITTTTIFGLPNDVTLDEMAIETLFPADDATALFLKRLSESTS